MRKLDIISMANKTSGGARPTILTCLGVVIGTASIVVMISLGIGLSSMEEHGTVGQLNIIRIHPGMQRYARATHRRSAAPQR